MSSLVVKDSPAALHGRLREATVRHQRSLTRQVIPLLETACGSVAPAPADTSGIAAPDAVPVEVRTLFETAFPGQEGTALPGRLMREAAEQELPWRRHALRGGSAILTRWINRMRKAYRHGYAARP